MSAIVDPRRRVSWNRFQRCCIVGFNRKGNENTGQAIGESWFLHNKLTRYAFNMRGWNVPISLEFEHDESYRACRRLLMEWLQKYYNLTKILSGEIPLEYLWILFVCYNDSYKRVIPRSIGRMNTYNMESYQPDVLDFPALECYQKMTPVKHENMI